MAGYRTLNTRQFYLNFARKTLTLILFFVLKHRSRQLHDNKNMRFVVKISIIGQINSLFPILFKCYGFT